MMRTPGLARLAVVCGGAIGRMRRNAGLGFSGGHIGLDLRDRIQRQMWFRVYESGTLALLDHFLSFGGSFLDVGAHIGYFAAFAASRVGAPGRVYAFEPDPSLFEQLSVNLRPWPWASVEWAAVGDCDGSSVLWRSLCTGESGWGTTLRPDGSERIPVRVPAVRLDTWRLARHLPEPVVIKVDVEGAEPAVLRGALQLLGTRSTRVALVEFNPICLSRGNVAAADLVRILRDAGYGVWSYPSFGRGAHDMLLALRPGEALDLPVTLTPLT